MSYAAEPYGQFVDNLLRGLTGGVVRTRFRMVDEDQPFRLAPPGPILPSTLVVFGQATGSYARFVVGRDFTISPDSVLEWNARPDGTPAADAVWPDEGTDFFVNYDHTGPTAGVPQLSDRNPGSVVRLLSESFAIELAVLSKQLESIYRAGFLDTATDRDLDQLVALVGLERRTRASAIGTVVFARTTPATADIFIPAGTRVSTADAPAAVFQTSVDGLLRRGNLSTEVAIRAEVPGPTGVVAANAIRVIHRPLFGLDAGVSNPGATALGSADETDEELRRRARRALETRGRATTGALIGALASLPGVRDKYVLAEEDNLIRPGVVSLRVAVDIDDDTAARAVELIEANRPVGIRILHDLDRHATLGPLEPALDVLDDDPDAPEAPLGGDGVYFPVVIAVQILPASAALSPTERAALAAAGKKAVADFIADVGVGEPLIYNKLVAALMAVPGVLDVRVEMYPQGAPPGSRRKQNLEPTGPLRPSNDLAHGGGTVVEVGGELIALDLTIGVTLVNAGLLGDPATNLEEARRQIARQIRDGVSRLTQLDPAALKGLASHSDTYQLDAVSYKAEFIQGGVRLILDNPPITVTSLERPWVRSLVLAGGG
jgi:uncharacterized phage protein gp47/JayE